MAVEDTVAGSEVDVTDVVPSDELVVDVHVDDADHVAFPDCLLRTQIPGEVPVLLVLTADRMLTVTAPPIPGISTPGHY